MFKKTAALVLSLAALTLMAAGCKKSDTTGEIKLPIYGAEEISYEIATAQYMDISETDSVGAIIGYPFADNLYYPANAQIISFDAIKGKTVEEGQVLAELDSSALDYDISNQQTLVNSAYAASLSGGEAARLKYEIEKYTLDMMLAEKEKYTIRAPYDGIITYVKRASAGSDVEAGAVCCTVAPENKVEVYIDGGDAAKFRFGQTAIVKIDGKEYEATVVQAPDVAPAEANNNASRRAVFRLGEGVMDKLREENAMAISAGWATVYATTERKNVLAVPDSAVKTSGSYSYVTLVDGEERYKLSVTIGQSIGGYTEILNGIAEGDIVMADGSGTFSTDTKDDKEEENGGWGDWNGEWNGEWGDKERE